MVMDLWMSMTELWLLDFVAWPRIKTRSEYFRSDLRMTASYRYFISN